MSEGFQNLDTCLPIVKPDFTANSDGTPKLTWIGHATVLLQVILKPVPYPHEIILPVGGFLRAIAHS